MKLFNNFLSLMQEGGPIMWVIFVAAAIAIMMLLWQFIKINTYVRAAKSDHAKILSEQTFAPHNQAKIASPIAILLSHINWPEVNDKPEMIKSINMQLAAIAPRLEGSLPTIATLGSLLPMLGLLGTVTGMITVFEMIALKGSGNPQDMASGISQALLTTASGLIYAIPVIFIHHLLAKKVQQLMIDTGQTVQIIIHRDLAIYKQEKVDG